MKKIILLCMIGILIGSALGTASTAVNSRTTQSLSWECVTPTIQIQPTDEGNYLSLALTDSSTYHSVAGQPRLPTVTHTIELPFAATDINVACTPRDITTQYIDQEIVPSMPLLPLTDEYQSIASQPTKDPSVYTMTTPYPDTWYTVKVGAGINENNQHVTFVTVTFNPIRYTPATGELLIAAHADMTVTYTPPDHSYFPAKASYDFVIIAPKAFEKALQPLVDAKNNRGIYKTYLKTTEDIYAAYPGRDKPEQIKYFIKDAMETQGITYVLLVGGLKNTVLSKPKDDSNQGSKSWYLPVRYTNLWDNPKFPLSAESAIFDPGVISDLYYADVYGPNGSFSSWDPNGDGIFAAWNRPGIANDTGIDLYPDINLGRLPCTSVAEVRTVVKKINTYEDTAAASGWFYNMTVVSGDGFLDQTDLNITWDTNTIPTGAYTIYAQSHNPAGVYGPIDTINITVDKTKTTVLTFRHDDNLLIHSYPGKPIAEIVTVSEGDTLGSTDYTFTPGENIAYCNEFYHWANVSYVSGVLTIRGKSYDPEPYGNLSSIHVWINNSAHSTVFRAWRNNTEMYYEGEYTTGEKALLGRGGALYYMPQNFTRNIVWASNGRFTGMNSLISEWNKGAGFVFISGHGSPNVWADHLPGIPGNRQNASLTGLEVTTVKPWPPFMTKPILPIDSLSNGEKLPVAVIGGCHNSQFNVSMVLGMLDLMNYELPRVFPKIHMWCSGYPVPECFSWRLIRNPHGGSIASMGNTGLGYGMPGIALTTGGGDSWLTIEFFRQYGALDHHVLGQAYEQCLATYVKTFDMTDLGAGHTKSVQEWVLFGDPTLQIGGYS
ncbi:MAG TPA: C25 family cysteine peptidase [Candidatus Thermoplasmatota archaeon]|nr:C25 family cysteine peptidase [Candidatus Thermoplasmatota archaeon]